jgi:hypothetical protein
MSELRIAGDGRSFQLDGTDAFIVADTVWSAFADAETNEWRQYVRRRAEQGFTHLLISVLPILHDRSVRDSAVEPFAKNAAGEYRYESPEERYFSRARELVSIAHDEGLRCCLVLLWCCYVPGTWGADRTPWAPIPPKQRSAYLDLAVDRFADLDPILIVSGDDAFSLESANEVYHDALRQVTARAPQLLTTMHSTPRAMLPDDIAADPALDFYSYQAGHTFAEQHLTWDLAEQYLGCTVRRPIVDLEPCYEGHGYGHGGGGDRWDRRQVRAATWWSILGGASAGIGYGAHGLWQWHRPGTRFTSPGFSLEPFPWEVALQFPGADDVALAAKIVADSGLIGAEPAQNLLVDALVGVRAALGRGGELGVYLPEAGEVVLDGAVDAAVMWDLSARRIVRPRLIREGGSTRIAQADFYGDALLIGVRA